MTVRNTYVNQERLRQAFLNEPWSSKTQAPRVVVTRNHVSLHIEGTAPPPTRRSQSHRKFAGSTSRRYDS